VEKKRFTTEVTEERPRKNEVEKARAHSRHRAGLLQPDILDPWLSVSSQ
jgi:hypothetical protein